jgi:hypothetical protein
MSRTQGFVAGNLHCNEGVGRRSEYDDSIQLAYEVLNETGFRICMEGATPEDVGEVYAKATAAVAKKTNEEILNLPEEDMDEVSHLIWNIFSSTTLFVWHSQRLLDHAFIVCSMTLRTMELGLSQYSGQAFALQCITCIVNNDFDLVKRLASLWPHPDMVRLYTGKEIEAGTRAAGNAASAHLYQPLTRVAEGFMKGYESGMATGSVEWAMTDAGCYLLTLFMSGLPLSHFETDAGVFFGEMK